MNSWKYYRDNSRWHHNWVANGPLWFLCGDCRRLRRLRIGIEACIARHPAGKKLGERT